MSGLEVVSCHYNEDLDWLKSCPHPVHVVGKEGGSPLDPGGFASVEIIPNLGHESSSYLRYMGREYDNLPERIVFIHGHETAHHQRMPMMAGIEKFGNLPFVDLNRTINVHMITRPESGLRYGFMWDEILRPELGTGMPLYVNFRLGGQFLVRRELIRSRPRKFYEDAYSKTMEICAKDPGYSKCAAMFFETFWHLIFGAESPIEDRCRPNFFSVGNKLLLETSMAPEEYVDMFMDSSTTVCGPTGFMHKLASFA